MFRQLVTHGDPNAPLTTTVQDNINSLFVYHPLQISALVETFWQNRNNAAASSSGSPFVPWSPLMASQILNAPFFSGYDWTTTPPTQLPPPVSNFTAANAQPGIVNTWSGTGPILSTMQSTNWDHLIYAYLIENTRIFEIFSKVLETYMFTEQLEVPSPVSQMFWRNLEFLIFGDAMPSMLWTTSTRVRHDEVANRLSTYYWMFGIDLSHASEIAALHPYNKPAAANRDFIPTFEAFAREVWRGIVNVKNFSGANDTDATVIATLARRIYDMMATRRLNGNLSREEFRAVSILSFIHLAVLYDSPAVVDLKCTASSPEMRLQKMAERVEMKSHPRTKPFFDLAGPFSILMQMIETGSFNDTAGAQTLYLPQGTAVSDTAETVIDQYSLATGRDVKAQTASVSPRPGTPQSKVPPHLASSTVHSIPQRTPDKLTARVG
jgi:hypothetical protein